MRLGKYKVRIEHRRRYFDPVNKRYAFLTKYEKSISALPDYVTMTATGGYTTVTVTTPDGITTQGIAKCSKYELYEKQVGVYLALKRALGGEGEGDFPKQSEFEFVKEIDNKCGGCHNCQCN